MAAEELLGGRTVRNTEASPFIKQADKKLRGETRGRGMAV